MKSRVLLIIYCSLILVVGLKAQNTIVEAEYFIGTDPGYGNATSIEISEGSDIADAFDSILDDMDPGTQFVHVRVKNDNDMWSIPVKVPFRIGQTEDQDVEAAEWFIDDDPGHGNAESVDLNADLNIEETIETSIESLVAGRHNFYLRVRSEEGNWGVTLKRPFVVNDKIPLNVVAAEYFVDQDPGIAEAIPLSISEPDHFIEELFNSDIQADLPEGDHFLYLRVQNEEGIWSINLVRQFIVANDLSTKDLLSQKVKVYPNPTIGPVNIDLGDLRMISVDIINSKGQLVKSISENTSQQQLPDLESGMYLLRITTDEGQLTKAIVVN